MKKQVSLSDKKFFQLSIGKRILKSHVFGNKTGIPAYSANVFKPFGFVKKSNIADFTKDYILWGIDGDFNFNIIPQGTFFATTDHCGVIDIKDKQIHPKYILYQLRVKSRELGFDRALRASLKNMRQVSVDIPIKQNGEFDMGRQKVIAEKYERIDAIKKGLRVESETVGNMIVQVPLEGETKTISLGNEKVFFVDTGERITKTDIVKSPGVIPVYSGSKSKNEPMGFVSDAVKKVAPKAKKYKGKYLTVNANGSVGKVFLRDEEFYLHDDVNIIQILDKNILYEYLLYELQNKIDASGYGVWTKKLYKTEMKEVVSVDIPIKQNGEFDLERQMVIAKKYERIEATKNQILELVRPLIETDIEF